MDIAKKADAAHYNDTVVRQFSIMAVVWGVVGMLARTQLRHSVAELWSLTTVAHQCSDLRLWR